MRISTHIAFVPIFVGFLGLVLLGGGCDGSPGDSAASEGAGGPAGAAVPASVVAAGEGEESFQISVDGMMCAVNCPPQVRAALGSVPGVARVSVDFQKKLAVVVAEEGAVAPGALVAALEATDRFRGEAR